MSPDLYRLLRLRVRPKVLLATSFEKALRIFRRFEDNILGDEGLVPNEDKVRVIDADIAAELESLSQQPHGGGGDS